VEEARDVVLKKCLRVGIKGREEKQSERGGLRGERQSVDSFDKGR